MNPYIESLTATCRGGQTVDNVARELLRIMLANQLYEGFVIHNDRKYRVGLYEEVKPK